MIDCIVQGDAKVELRKLETSSVDLVVTSPPYNCSKSYEQILSETEYLSFITPIAEQLSRVLKPDGRFCINVAFSINRPEEDGNHVLFPFLSWTQAIQAANLHLKENIIWDKFNNDRATCWGSWKSPSAPHIRHQTEFVLIGYKNQWQKLHIGKSDLTASEFTLWTMDRWEISPERKRLHPAPFPEELAKRCIKLFSYVGDVVLDPFVGSGTVCVVAKKYGRHFIGVDLSAEYCGDTLKRLANVPFKLEKYMNER